MKINLLKNRRTLSEKDYLREKQFLQYSVTALVVVLIVTIAMALWNFALSSKLSGIEATITKANTQLEGLAEANVQQIYVKNRLGLIGTFLDDQSVARESLQQILALSIPGAAIGGLRFVDERSVSVVVRAESQPVMAEVIEYYTREDSYFPQVVSEGMSRLKDGMYEIKLIVTLPVEKQKS